MPLTISSSRHPRKSSKIYSLILSYTSVWTLTGLILLVKWCATRDGYHGYPDLDWRTLTNTDTQKIGCKKSAERLETSLDLDAVMDMSRSRSMIQVNQGKSQEKGGDGKD